MKAETDELEILKARVRILERNVMYLLSLTKHLTNKVAP